MVSIPPRIPIPGTTIPVTTIATPAPGGLIIGGGTIPGVAGSFALPGATHPPIGGGATPGPGAQPPVPTNPPTTPPNTGPTTPTNPSPSPVPDPPLLPPPPPPPPDPTQRDAEQCDMDGMGTVTGGGPNRLRAGGRSRVATKPIAVRVGDASFSFPPIAISSRSNRAPNVKFGRGWTAKTDASGRAYMQHTNGTKVYTRPHPRVTVSPPGVVRSMKIDSGPAKRFPDGTLLQFREGKPFVKRPGGEFREIGFGRHRFGGVSARIFQATEARVIAPDGRYLYYDSRGNSRFGRTGGSASVLGGGGPGSGVEQVGGGPSNLSGLIDDLLEMTHGLLEQLEGEADPGMLSQAHTMLNGLPAALGQSVSGATMMSHDDADA